MPVPGASPRTLIPLAALVVALVAIAGAIYLRLTDEDSAFIPIPSQESVYTEGVAGEAQRINPLFATENQVDADLSRLIFSGLVKLDGEGTVRADLADLPVIGEGGRTYTFTLRDGLQWHDGVLVDSADVLFTITVVRDGAFTGQPELARAWSDVDVSAPDSRTITIRTEQPSAPFLARFATLGILPEHLLRDVSVATLADAAFNAAPIGTGPYKLQSLSSVEARLENHAPKRIDVNVREGHSRITTIELQTAGSIHVRCAAPTLGPDADAAATTPSSRTDEAVVAVKRFCCFSSWATAAEPLARKLRRGVAWVRAAASWL